MKYLQQYVGLFLGITLIPKNKPVLNLFQGMDKILSQKQTINQNANQ